MTFYLVGRSDTDHCKSIMLEFMRCMCDLGVPVASEKTEGPKTVIIFLGLEIDSEKMMVRVPTSKSKRIN